MRVHLWLLKDFMIEVELMAAHLRAIEIIAGMEATGMPVDEHFTMPNPPELPMMERAQ